MTAFVGKRFQILLRKIRKSIDYVPLHRGKIAARQRPCPCRARTHAFKIIQGLPRQREQRTNRLPARETLRHHHARGGFHQRQDVRTRKRTSRMIRRLVRSRQADGYTSHLPDHFSRATLSAG